MADTRTPFDIWRWEMDQLVHDLTDRWSPDSSDPDGANLERQQRDWFAHGMPVEEAAERTALMMIRLGVFKDRVTYTCFPDPPRHPNGEIKGPDYGWGGGGYRVLNDADMVAVYIPIYYRSTDEVIPDLIKRLKAEEIKGKWSGDFVIWHAGRIRAVLRESMTSTRPRWSVIRFTTRRRVARADDAHKHAPGWPTRQQWIASGKGPLWFDKDNPENPAV